MVIRIPWWLRILDPSLYGLVSMQETDSIYKYMTWGVLLSNYIPYRIHYQALNWAINLNYELNNNNIEYQAHMPFWAVLRT